MDGMRTRALAATLTVMLTLACSDPGAPTPEGPAEVSASTTEPEPSTETDVRYRPIVDEGAEVATQRLRYAVFVESAEPPHQLYLTANEHPPSAYCPRWSDRSNAIAIEPPSLELGRTVDNGAFGMEGVALGVHEDGSYRGLGFQDGRFELTAVDEATVRGEIRLILEDRVRPSDAGSLSGSFVARRQRCP